MPVTTKTDDLYMQPGETSFFGFFPEITKRWNKGWDANQFSNIIALDVFEHIEDSIGFLSECNWLMVKGGHLIIQSPIILEDGQMDDKMFNGLEHIWIYGIQDLAKKFVASSPVCIRSWLHF